MPARYVCPPPPSALPLLLVFVVVSLPTSYEYVATPRETFTIFFATVAVTVRPCALSRAEITSPTSTSMSSWASTSTLPWVWYSLSFFLPSSSSFSSSALL